MTTFTMPTAETDAQTTVKQLFDLIIAQGDGDYCGEAVSQLQHSLQTATLAQLSGADDDTIIGALLHDIGHFLPMTYKVPMMAMADGTSLGPASHDIRGEQYLRVLGFNDKICELVGAHVMAKKYLCAVDKTYYDTLSKASKATLKYQGGPFNDEQVKAAQEDPWLDSKLAIRRWDDQAKDPEVHTPPLSSFAKMTVQSLSQARSNSSTVTV